MRKRIWIFVVFFFSLLTIKAQYFQLKDVSVNMNRQDASTILNESWPIRQDVGNLPNSWGNTFANIKSFGVASEMFVLNKKWTVTPGISFYNLQSAIMKDDYARGGYFFLRNDNNSDGLDFIRVKAIEEKSNYLGIPISLKYTPFTFWNTLSLYAQLTADLAYQISSDTSIEFKLPEMQSLERDVLNTINQQNNPFYASLYASLGMHVKLSKMIYLSLDLVLPEFIRTSNNSSLMSLQTIGGGKFSIYFPLLITK